MLTRTHQISCPYCGQTIEVIVDPSVPFQEYVEDCEVCCRAITLSVVVDGERQVVDARGEDE